MTNVNQDPHLSVAIPCYNEELGLRALHERVSAACQRVVGSRYEIVLINDGSRDSSWQVMAALAQSDPHVVAVNLSRNHGHQLALTAGLSVCAGDRILIIDADLQDPPELLGEMMRLMDEGADVVYGKRSMRAGETVFKRMTASLFYQLLARMTDVSIPVNTGDFRLVSRRVVSVLQAMPEQHRFIRGMVSWIGFRQVPIMYDRAERFAGQTNYPFHKMLRFAADAITGFSTLPLRVSSYAGAMLGIAALAMIGYALIGYWQSRVVQGWTSVMIAVLLLGSAQMFFLGILGEYVGRLYIEAKRRPLYVITEVVGARAPVQEQVATRLDEGVARIL
ncbi:MAG: glycosyltransferase family 2 protein [Acidobacteria bacterium]|nr:glycosyltransferase family 2 protein [Acidobacteriota bacterium]MCA1649581.1 glycosyltransferase family 2 protein [Acidobacteriota bacterium]